MKIAITGGAGFLGSHLTRHLNDLGYTTWPIGSDDFNLTTAHGVNELFWHLNRDDVIFHCAANVGGIHYNINNAGSLYYDNIMMNTQLIDRAAKNGIAKFVMVGSVCSYPKHPPIPTREVHLWDGYPEESNGAYGVSKLAALAQLQACKEQYGLNFGYPLLANLYGPSDHFEDDRSHVIPALIKKFMSGADPVTVWGDGSATRDFLFVEDAVRGLATYLNTDCPEPVNISTNYEVRISNLVDAIVSATGYTGEIVYDDSKPSGQKRRRYDNRRAQEALGWEPRVNIVSGIKRTVEWYKSQFK